MRITGLATGLDMDELVKSTMQPYRIKIQQTQQKKEIVEIKQKLYREVINDCRDFYNKYFDVSKSSSILLTKNWGATTYTSSNEAAVTVKGLSGAKSGNYEVSGTKATASKAEIDTNISAGDKVVVNEKEFTLRGKDETEIAKNLNADLKAAGINVEAKYSKFSTSGSGDSVLVLEATVLGKEGAFTVGGNVEVAVGTAGTDTTKGGITIPKDELSSGITLTYGDNKTISLTANALENETALNNALDGTGLIGTIDKEGNVVIESKDAGASEEYPIKATVSTNMSAKNYVDGVNANIVIKDKSNGSIYTHTGNTNTITVDNMQFSITDDIPTGSEVSITGKTDVTEVKDMLVNFINDYNTVIEKLNTLTMEKRNRSFDPLTDEQKAEMSESEIELWNKKVEQGQLSKDSDVTRIANQMKKSMSSLVDGVSGNLEKFGIKPVADYQSTKNGTFTVDETKLTEALENNMDDIMKLFIGTPSSDTAEADKYSNTGIAQRLKSILYDETVTVSSVLIKKAGIENSATTSNNQLTKSIEKYEKKMEDMETDFTRREQALYSKWARVETLMNTLNSQQSYLTSQLG